MRSSNIIKKKTKIKIKNSPTQGLFFILFYFILFNLIMFLFFFFPFPFLLFINNFYINKKIEILFYVMRCIKFITNQLKSLIQPQYNININIMSQQIDNTNTEQLECPICFDTIETNTNCVTTECGHKFHCSCLMKNTATNGFGCPMCRQVMAEVVDDDDSVNSSNWLDLDNDTQNPDDNALTSFRMFQQQLDNEEVEEDAAPAVNDNDDDDDESVEEPLPSPAYLATKMAEKGITMEDMVKALLLEHDEYEDDFEVFDRRTSEMYGELRRIILNYRV